MADERAASSDKIATLTAHDREVECRLTLACDALKEEADRVVQLEQQVDSQKADLKKAAEMMLAHAPQQVEFTDKVSSALIVCCSNSG